MKVTAGNIPPESWDALSKSGPLFASRAWLSAIEGRAAGTPHYFELGEVGIAGMAAENPDFDAPVNVYELLTGSPPWMPLTEKSAELRHEVKEKTPPAGSWFPNLVVTLPSARCMTVGSNRGSAANVDRLVDELIDWAREQKMAAISFLYLPPVESVLEAALTNRGLLRLPLTHNCELSLPGDNFDDYLTMLSSGRRNSIRREIREVAEANLRIERRPLDECVDDLVRLRLRQKQKYGRAQNEPKARRAFTGLIDNFPPEDLLLFVAEAEGSMVSFSLYLAEGPTWHALLTGTEYDDPRWKFAYFDLLFYTPIRHAYESGARRLDLGGASWEAKRNRGCDLVRHDGFLLAFSPELMEAATESARVTELRF